MVSRAVLFCILHCAICIIECRAVDFREDKFSLFAAVTSDVNSIKMETVPFSARSPENLLKIIWAEDSLKEDANDAVHLVNSYYNLPSVNFSPARKVVIYTVINFPNRNTQIGSAQYFWYNQTWVLKIKRSGTHNIFNTVLHEVLHVVIDSNKVAYNDASRKIDSSNHWSPWEEREVFSPLISNNVPFLAPYTIEAASNAESLMCNFDKPCANTDHVCGHNPYFRRVPSICLSKTENRVAKISVETRPGLQTFFAWGLHPSAVAFVFALTFFKSGYSYCLNVNQYTKVPNDMFF